MSVKYTNDEVVAMLFAFEQFIVKTYGLHARLADGQIVVLQPQPGALVEAWRKNLQKEDCDETVAVVSVS